MKNRLEVAREFLRDDGVIFIQCDDNEQAYLKVLCDEIFGRENFVGCLVWANKEGGGKSDSKHFRQKHEYILCFAKNKEKLEIYGKGVEDIERYKFSDKYEATRGKYQLVKLDSGSLGWIKSLDYPIELNGKIFYAGGNYERWVDRQNGGASIKDWGWRWRWSREKLDWGLENDFIEIKQNSSGEWNIYTKQYLNCDNEGNIKPRILKPMALIEKYSNTQSNRHIKELQLGFTYSKPEALIMEILDYSTKKGDLVMDFFAGSGTTLAVAHKMNRRWVGIEQMDYIENITKERLKKVILGEQGGVSKIVGWNPTEATLLEKEDLSNSFLYAELMPLNETYKKLIIDANEEIISDVILKMQKNAFLDYRVDFARAVVDEDFISLSLDDKKKILLQCLDSNLSYVPFSEIKDSEFGISDEMIEANEALYKGRSQ